MHKVTRLLAAATLLLAPAAQAQTTSFVAFGDMPYGLSEEVFQRYEGLLDVIAEAQPAFAVHVGDTKSGSTPCSDELLGRVLNSFQTTPFPLMYTPGDNEWTDCHRAKAGEYDPLERLAYVRRTFFANPSQSLGARRLPVTSQKELPENAIWQRGGAVFATVHVVGSNNGLERNPQAAAEFFTRNAANVAWMKTAFAHAKKVDAGAVVLFMQADMFETGGLSGFADTLRTLKAEANAFEGTVLLVHGDSHVLKFDQPFNNYDDNSAPNIYRLEVPGDQRMQAVEVTLDSQKRGPSMFSYRVLELEE